MNRASSRSHSVFTCIIESKVNFNIQFLWREVYNPFKYKTLFISSILRLLTVN